MSKKVEKFNCKLVPSDVLELSWIEDGVLSVSIYSDEQLCSTVIVSAEDAEMIKRFVNQ